jgi:hypothetical protein
MVPANIPKNIAIKISNNIKKESILIIYIIKIRITERFATISKISKINLNKLCNHHS